ncbi:hypothetical protein SRHO_G00311900 [Serrasalmus rhombeus]
MRNILLQLLQPARPPSQRPATLLFAPCDSCTSPGPQTKHCRVIMLEVMSSQFDSFLFWRQPIPSLDLSELEDLGLSELVPKSSQMGKGGKSSAKSPPVDEDDDLDLSEFSTFNYWKEPIASIDVLDFNLLL